THTLEYNWTVVTLGSQFTSVGLLDGEEFMYYDSNTAKMTPKTEWIKKVETDSSYWERETRDVAVQRDWLKGRLRALESGIQAKGGDTLQRVYGCEIDDNGTTSGYDKSIYNGKVFISLDLNTGTWTAVDERAKSFTEDWNPERRPADDWKDFLMETCVERLKRYKSYSTKKEPGAEGRSEGGPDVGAEGRSEGGPDVGAEGRSEGGPEGGLYGGKTTITAVVVLVLVLAAAAVGFVIYKTQLC
ncbi:BOLA class I histocompatibility antigen, alpha chain BL3-7-like isoform X1, partial [Clarias magur]